MPEKKQPAILTMRQLKGEALQFSVQEEMLALIARVRGNKSKRTAKTLVKEGPLRVLIVALDAGGKLEEHAVDGPFSVQCLLGKAAMRVGGQTYDLGPGGLVVVDSLVPHDLEAIEATALLITIAAPERK